MKASLNHLRRRFPRLMAVLLCTLLLSGCSQLLPDPVRSAQSTLVPGVDTVLPDAEPAEAATSLREVTLYFRYEDQPYLAPETRSLTVAPDEPFELALLRELAQGPSPSSVQLTSALPEGCLILSVAAQGRTLFVTLSNNILAGWSDEPATWEQDPYWQVEAPLRRQLCMQSIVATITENCNYDGVQMLVEQTDVLSDSLRLRQSWFLDGSGDDVLTSPLIRQEQYLLTPSNTLRAALNAWSTQELSVLYGYLAAADRPSYEDFTTFMQEAPRLINFGFTGGSVSPDGGTTLYTLHLYTQHQGVSQEWSGRIMRLVREGDLWKIPWTQFTGWMEE